MVGMRLWLEQRVCPSRPVVPGHAPAMPPCPPIAQVVPTSPSSPSPGPVPTARVLPNPWDHAVGQSTWM